MITLTRKKLKLLSSILTTIWIVIIFTTKSFTWMISWAAVSIGIILPVRYLYYKQLTNKNEKRNYLISELTSIALLIIVIVLALVFFW